MQKLQDIKSKLTSVKMEMADQDKTKTNKEDIKAKIADIVKDFDDLDEQKRIVNESLLYRQQQINIVGQRNAFGCLAIVSCIFGVISIVYKQPHFAILTWCLYLVGLFGFGMCRQLNRPLDLADLKDLLSHHVHLRLFLIFGLVCIILTRDLTTISGVFLACFAATFLVLILSLVHVCFVRRTCLSLQPANAYMHVEQGRIVE